MFLILSGMMNGLSVNEPMLNIPKASSQSICDLIDMLDMKEELAMPYSDSSN